MTVTQLPDAVQWSEGMLLSPQHMQQNDIYWHEQLRHRLACITPYFWGIRRLTVQLIKETINVSELDCVLPNGLALLYPGNFPRQPELLLQLKVSECKAGEAPLRVWILVPERGTNAARQTDQDRRYNSQVGNITIDENTGEGDIAVARLQTRCELILSAVSPSAGQGACPLLEVMRDAQGVLHISDYLPPMLCLSASDFLGSNGLQQSITALHQTWWNQAQELACEASGLSPDGKFNSAGIRNQFVARQLASALPSLSILLEAQTHPQQVYQALTNLVGQMALFAVNPLPLKMTPYQHDDSLAQFQAAWRYIEDTMAIEFQRIRQERLSAPKPMYDTRPFQAHGDSGFGRQLPQQIERDLIIEVKLREGQSLEQIGRWLNQADIASASLIPQLRRQRVPGARVRQLGSDEIVRYQLPELADLFVIENRTVDLAEIGSRDLFSAAQSLFIQGSPGPHMPAAIFLYHKISNEMLNT